MSAFVEWVQALPPDQFYLLLAGLAAATGIGFWQWKRRLKGARTIEDVPTSKVRSAAQGYVELVGRQSVPDGETRQAPLTNRSCTWWRYRIEEKKKRRDSEGKKRTEWVTLEEKTSPHLIHFEDATGSTIVNPAGAEVVPSTEDTWYGRTRKPTTGPEGAGSRLLHNYRYRYTEAIMRPGEPMYAIGHFETRTGVPDEAEQARLATELLKEWKADQEELVERFDADEDGTVDVEEWEAARAEAARVVQREVEEKRGEPTVHLMLEPDDGRPFILSSKSQEELASHFRRRTLAWLALWLVSGALLGVAAATRTGS